MSSRTVNTRRTYPPRLPANRAPIRYKPKPKASASRYARKPKASASADNSKITIVQAARAYPRGGYTLNNSLLNITPSYAFNYMNPFNGYGSKPPHQPTSLGNFLAITHSNAFTLNTSTTDPLILIYMPSVRGVYQLLLFNSVSGANIAAANIASPLYRYNASGTETKPLSVRMLRSAMQIQNTTENQKIAGLVKSVQISSPLDFNFISAVSLDVTTVFAAEVAQVVNSHSRTVENTAQQYAQKVAQVVIAPATSSSYNGYGDHSFNPTLGVGSTQLTFSIAQNDMSMNTQIFMFMPTSSVNTYSIKLCSQNAFRFPSNTTLGQLQGPAPPAGATFAAQMAAIHEALARNPDLNFNVQE